MHRWHRGQLPRDGAAPEPIDRLAVLQRQIDDPRAAREEAWRRHRDQLQREAHAGAENDDVAPPGVLIAMPHEHPYEEHPHAVEVGAAVVPVGDVDEPRVTGDQVLHGQLARYVPGAFGVPDGIAVRDTTIDMRAREVTDVLPEREQQADE